MDKRSLVASLAGIGLLMASSAVFATPCIKDAKNTQKECKAGCVEDFQSAKDACLNRDHDCVEACRDGRQQCEDSSGLNQALDACQAQLATDKQSCRQQFPAGSNDRDDCIDQMQVKAFTCRQAARKQFGPAFRACKKGFRACAAACPPADPNAPPVDVPACKQAANDTYKTCKANCLEDYQVGKDACLNRDHACVETCRSNRDDCRQPVDTDLASAIASCNNARDNAIAGCNQDATCIENARVTAFECRDQAREDAAPSYAQCRSDFQACEQACPPPSPS